MSDAEQGPGRTAAVQPKRTARRTGDADGEPATISRMIEDMLEPNDVSLSLESRRSDGGPLVLAVLDHCGDPLDMVIRASPESAIRALYERWEKGRPPA